jgi:cobalamin biosynthesis Mg chelatase CobN
MDSRVRTLAFAVLLIGLSAIVLIQTFQASVASTGEGLRAVSIFPKSLVPLQSANSTTSSQSVSGNSTMQNANATTSSQAMSANSTSVANSTTTQPTSSLQSSATVNEATAVSQLQYQMSSLNDQLVAMSSSMSSVNQQTGTNTLIAEAGLIIGILALVAAIAVARRADALYRDASQSQTAPSAPPGK